MGTVHLITLSRMILFPLILSVLASANFAAGLPVDSTYAAIFLELVAACDQDNSGDLSFSPEMEDCVKSSFGKSDVNNDGVLTKGEKKFDTNCDANGDEELVWEEAIKCLDNYFKALDRNGDGIGTYEELLQAAAVKTGHVPYNN